MPMSCFPAISAGEKHALCFAEASAVPDLGYLCNYSRGWAVPTLREPSNGRGFLTRHTTLAPEALKKKLRHWEPWGHRIDFDNGVSTKDFRRRIPFSQQSLSKLRFVEVVIPFANMSCAKLLDVGCCAG
jgi:hypothetical protein